MSLGVIPEEKKGGGEDEKEEYKVEEEDDDDDDDDDQPMHRRSRCSTIPTSILCSFHQSLQENAGRTP
jgi:hypothetical protein